MFCSKCNYLMDAFDKECPRCHGEGTQPTDQPAPEQAADQPLEIPASAMFTPMLSSAKPAGTATAPISDAAAAPGAGTPSVSALPAVMTPSVPPAKPFEPQAEPYEPAQPPAEEVDNLVAAGYFLLGFFVPVLGLGAMILRDLKKLSNKLGAKSGKTPWSKPSYREISLKLGTVWFLALGLLYIGLRTYLMGQP